MCLNRIPDWSAEGAFYSCMLCGVFVSFLAVEGSAISTKSFGDLK